MLLKIIAVQIENVFQKQKEIIGVLYANIKSKSQNLDKLAEYITTTYTWRKDL